MYIKTKKNFKVKIMWKVLETLAKCSYW